VRSVKEFPTEGGFSHTRHLTHRPDYIAILALRVVCPFCMSFHKLSVLEGKVVSDLQCMNIVWDLLCGFIARNSSKASRCLVVELGKVGCELDLQPVSSHVLLAVAVKIPPV